MAYKIQVNGQTPIEIDESILDAKIARTVIENLIKEKKYSPIISHIQNNDDINCKRIRGGKKKYSYLDKYLYLHEMFLSLFGVKSWQELKELYARDENGDIFIDLTPVAQIDGTILDDAVGAVLEYEIQLKKLYRNQKFSFTDYQVFSILFTEIFLMQKTEMIDIFSHISPENIVGIRVFPDAKIQEIIEAQVDERVVLIAKLLEELQKNGEPKRSIVREYEKINLTSDEYLEQALYNHFSIISSSKYLLEFNKLAYYMATGSGKTVILHTNIMQAYKFFGKKSNLYLIVPTKELGKQHRKNLIKFGFKESDIGFYEDEGSKKTTVAKKVKEILEASYEIKILTNSQLSVVNKQNSCIADRNIVFVDEGHKGDSNESGWREDRKSILGDDGFAFEYSATFSHAIKDNIKLLQEYSKAIIFDYPYYKFYNDNYGKQAEFEPKEIIKNDFKEEISDKEGFKLFVKDMLSFLEQHLYYQNGRQDTDFKQYHFEKPLKLMICRRVDDKNGDSDVKKAIEYIQQLSNKKETIACIKQAIDAFSYIGTMEAKEVYGKLFEVLFHAEKPSSIEVFELNSKELGLKVSGATDYFCTIYVGEVSKIGISGIRKDLLQKSLIESFFKSGDNPLINIVISARMLIEGWDTQRISSLSLFDFGKSAGSLIVQLFGRGVRLHGSDDMQLKRSGKHPILERFNIYGYNSAFLKTFIEEAELGDISKDKTIEILIEKNMDMLNKKLPLVVPKSTFSQLSLEYIFNKDIAEQITSKVFRKYHLIEGEYALSLLPLVHIRSLYSIFIDALKYKNYYISYREFEKGVEYILSHEIRLKANYQFKNTLAVEQIAHKLIKSFFEEYYKIEQKKYELSNPHLTELNQDDSNISFERFTVTGTAERIDVLLDSLGQKEKEFFLRKDGYDYKSEFHIDEDIFAIACNIHAYSPLLVEHKRLKISPDRLVESEKIFIQTLNTYLRSSKAKKAYKEIYLLRNQQKIGFKGFYPDFILWLIDQDDNIHFVFVDPKGINNFNIDSVWDKILFAIEIKEIEKIVQKENPQLYLHSFICATKSLENLSSNEIINNFLSGKITKEFIEKNEKLSQEQLKNSLKLLNVLSLEDTNFIDVLIDKVCNKDSDSLQSFLFSLFPSLENELEEYWENEVKRLNDCTGITNRKQSNLFYFYKYVLKSESLSEELCKSYFKESGKDFASEVLNTVADIAFMGLASSAGIIGKQVVNTIKSKKLKK